MIRIKINDMELTQEQKEALDRARKHRFNLMMSSIYDTEGEIICLEKLNKHFDNQIISYHPDFYKANDILILRKAG